MFFRMRVGIDVGWIFGCAKPRKSSKSIDFSIVFVNVHKIDVCETDVVTY